MTRPLFEQYKEALRRGHLAARAGRVDEALEAYREAARIAPDRAAPHTSTATVLHRAGRRDEAWAAFERALATAPDDEATLRARAAAFREIGRTASAAADLERLAEALDLAGRRPEALEAAREAVELTATAARRRLVERLQAPEAEGPTPPPVRAMPPRPAVAASPSPGPPAPSVPSKIEPAPEIPIAGSPVSSAPKVAPAGPAPGPGISAASPPPPVPAPAAAPIAAPTPAPTPEPEPPSEPAIPWPAIDLPSAPPPMIVGPPPNVEFLMAEANALVDAGELLLARNLMLTAVAVHRAAGRSDAALDVCLQLLALAPGDAHVHLAIAGLQLDRGWRTLATEKIELLLRLTGLTGDTQAEADVHALAAERLRDEPPAGFARH